jgi:hypothetical protein
MVYYRISITSERLDDIIKNNILKYVSKFSSNNFLIDHTQIKKLSTEFPDVIFTLHISDGNLTNKIEYPRFMRYKNGEIIERVINAKKIVNYILITDQGKEYLAKDVINKEYFEEDGYEFIY